HLRSLVGGDGIVKQLVGQVREGIKHGGVRKLSGQHGGVTIAQTHPGNTENQKSGMKIDCPAYSEAGDDRASEHHLHKQAEEPLSPVKRPRKLARSLRSGYRALTVVL